MSKELFRENLQKANEKIKAAREAVSKGKYRQHFHFMGEAGWINDPNGMIFYKGKYHLYYQFNPYDAFWGMMHWGHAVSSDLVHWEHLPVALAPSESYDNDSEGGCFSGTAMEHEGRLYVAYTGAAKSEGVMTQAQCLAVSEDGCKFEKFSINPVVTVPEGVESDSFRDPKIWKHEDKFYMLCGASFDGDGQAILYRSDDLESWEQFSVLAKSDGKLGWMWECPDFFQIGDKYVLTTSPMNNEGHTAVYMIGDFDYETGIFKHGEANEIDFGFDYYAPQSLRAPDGRVIITAWANSWKWMPHFKDWGPTHKEGWCGFFNLPREVSLIGDGDDARLAFRPVRELEVLREGTMSAGEIRVCEDEYCFAAGDGIHFEIKFIIDLERTTANKIELDLRCVNGQKTVCLIDLEGQRIILDRSASDGYSSGCSESKLHTRGQSELDVHIFSDTISLEIFTDRYTTNHSSNIYPLCPEAAEPKNCILAHGGVAVIRGVEVFSIEKSLYNRIPQGERCK